MDGPGAGGPVQPGPWEMPPAVDREDRDRVRLMGRTIDSLYAHLRREDRAPDPEQVRRYAIELLEAADATVRRSAWSPAAEECARATSPGIDDLGTRVTELERALRGPDAPESALGPAVRIGVGVFVGALLAGPLAALVPTTWIPWASEPLKAAIGGGVGAFTAEVTKPIDAWLARSRRDPDERSVVEDPDGIVVLVPPRPRAVHLDGPLHPDGDIGPGWWPADRGRDDRDIPRPDRGLDR